MYDDRPLTHEDIQALVNNGCRADNWDDISVSPDFNPDHYHRVTFSGKLRLGSTKASVQLSGNRETSTGIYNAIVHNCTIGDNVYIANVHSVLANYQIDDHVIIENVGTLAVEGETSFGNGTRVKVINEGGGREVAIYDKLSAQTAYFLSVFRHRPKLVERLERMIESYTDMVISEIGQIGESAKIQNCQTINNVNIGPHTGITNACLLENGSINSESDSQTKIGAGVIAKNFIFNQGSIIADGAVLENVYVGQACTIASQFSAIDTLIFANSKCLNGEACSAFLGPFSTTDHKSSLIIAGMVSFWNSGSGTNQSNHLYKLGPVHQGMMERGCKTASNAYVMWPARIGAFTLVMGRIYSHPNTMDLPFSYLFGNNDGTTTLVPAVNLKSIGIYRDNQKWLHRDKRKATIFLDRVRPNVYNPYTVGKMIKAVSIIDELLHPFTKEQTSVLWNGCMISKTALQKAKELYDWSIIFYLGSVLFSVIHKAGESFINWAKQQNHKETHDIAIGEWRDFAGMIAPLKAIDNVIQDVESGTIGGLSQFRPIVCGIHHNYDAFLLPWAMARLEEKTGTHPLQWTVDNLNDFSTEYLDAIAFWQEQLLSDAGKEFTSEMMVGYGPSGNHEEMLQDFTAIHGNPKENPVVKELLQNFSDMRTIVEPIIAK